MTKDLRVILEIGIKRRVVAGAMNWPGLDRWGTSEDDALAKLSSYLARYAGVAERAGMVSAFTRSRGLEVIERMPGSSSTDFWGIAHVPSEIERDVLSPADLDRRLELLRACWDYFEDVAARVSAELRPQPRGGGRSRDSIIRHTHGTESENWSRKVGVKTPLDVVLTPEGLDASEGVPRGHPRLQRGGQIGPDLADPVSCAVPLTTSWITRGNRRTGTSHPEDPQGRISGRVR